MEIVLENQINKYVYDNANGKYVWYNNFCEAFDHMDFSGEDEK